MAQRDLFKRSLEAGAAFTEMTRARAEGIVKDLVKAGDLPRERAKSAVDDILDQGRRNTEAIVALVQLQVREQLSQLGLATKDDIARLEAKIEGKAKAAAKKAPATKKAPAAKKAPARS